MPLKERFYTEEKADEPISASRISYKFNEDIPYQLTQEARELIKSLPNDESITITYEHRKVLARVNGIPEDVVLDEWSEDFVHHAIKNLHKRLHTRQPLIVSLYRKRDNTALFRRGKTTGDWIGIDMVEPYHQ